MLYIRHYTLIEIIFFIVNLQLYFYYQTKILNFVTPTMTYFKEREKSFSYRFFGTLPQTAKNIKRIYM